MQQDAQGNALSTGSAAVAQAFDHAVAGYLGYRADTPQRLQALLATDAEFGMAQALKATFLLLGYKQSLLPMAREAIDAAARLTAGATPREQAHVAALTAWAAGEMDRATATWEGILAEHPRDILAFRLHHFCSFWLGRPEAMLAQVEAVLPRWGKDVPGYGAHPRLPRLRQRGKRPLHRRRGSGPGRDRARPRRPLGGACGRPCAGDAGPPQRGHRLARRTRAALGGRQQHHAPSLVAPRACSTWSSASSPACSTSTTPASATWPRR